MFLLVVFTVFSSEYIRVAYRSVLRQHTHSLRWTRPWVSDNTPNTRTFQQPTDNQQLTAEQQLYYTKHYNSLMSIIKNMTKAEEEKILKQWQKCDLKSLLFYCFNASCVL